MIRGIQYLENKFANAHLLHEKGKFRFVWCLCCAEHAWRISCRGKCYFFAICSNCTTSIGMKIFITMLFPINMSFLLWAKWDKKKICRCIYAVSIRNSIAIMKIGNFATWLCYVTNVRVIWYDLDCNKIRGIITSCMHDMRSGM